MSPVPAAGGQSLDGFALGERVGRGATGEVYRGVHVASGSPVAVKFVDAGFQAAVLRREVEASAALDHPHVVPVLAAGERDGRAWMVMAWAPGGNLDEAPPRDAAEARTLLEQLLLALAHAHARGVAHLDVKPANLLRGARGEVRLADFGIARSWRRSDEVVRAMSPGFAAPEQISRRWDRVGPAADLWAVGAVARWMGLDDLDGWIAWCQATDPSLRPTAPAALRALVGDARRAIPEWRSLEAGSEATGPAGRSLLALRDPPVVGRDGVRDALWTTLQEVAASGSPRCVRLVGPEGAGRQRLMRWLAETSEERLGVRVVDLRPRGGSDPLVTAARAALVALAGGTALARKVGRPHAPTRWKALARGEIASPYERWGILADLVGAWSTEGPVVMWPVAAVGWSMIAALDGPVLALSTEVGEEVVVQPPTLTDLTRLATVLGEQEDVAARLAEGASGSVDVLLRSLLGVERGRPLEGWAPGPRRVVEAAAVVGVAVDAALWSALARTYGEDPADVAAQAVREGLMRRDEGLRFLAEQRAAVLEGISDASEAHRAVAEALGPNADPVELELHRTLAGEVDWRRLFRRIVLAADAGDSANQARLCVAATTVAEALPPSDPRRGRARALTLATIVRREAYLEATAPFVEEAIAAGWHDEAAEALARMACVLGDLGRTDEAEAALARADAMGPRGISAWRADAVIRGLRGDLGGREEALLRSAAIGVERGQVQFAGQLVGMVAASRMGRGDLHGARDALARVPDQPDKHILLGDLHTAEGDLDAAEREYHATLASTAIPHFRALATASLGVLALIRGERGHARDLFSDAGRVFAATRDPMEHVCSAGQAVCALRDGDPTTARRWARSSRRIPEAAMFWEELDAAGLLEQTDPEDGAARTSRPSNDTVRFE
ncbi:MAG: serine/threonine protein kinase [Alphaproteobacteria bacterium]|nr:serine/threonine protein kinase [Alphaproteobacteria bacterium]